MRFVKNDLPATLKTLEIEIFADLHLGSKKCDFKLIQERVERVRTHENVYAVIGGDICNTATKNSKSDVYSDVLTPKEEIDRACMLFEPIKDKILGACSGNHENRILRESGYDILYSMCARLGIEHVYSNVSVLMFVRFGSTVNKGSGYVRRDGTKGDRKSIHSGRKILYTIYLTHGSGGGRTIGAKANALARRGEIIDSDIVIGGHTHQDLTFRQKSFKIDPHNCMAHEFEQVFVNASSSLDYEDYAESLGLRPTSKNCPVIILDGTEKKIKVLS